jgi:DNA-binding winged helix-turn-helix (wHTH) protein/TolB-like protein/Flp pilus assembly protein TadD
VVKDISNPGTRSGAVYEFASFRLDPDEQRLLRDGVPVALTPKAFATLHALVERQGHLVSKDELLSRVWEGVFVEEATLTQNVYTLRKLLGDGRGGVRLIETVPRRGYRFVAPVRVLSSGGGERSAAGERALDLPGSAGEVRAGGLPRRLAVLPFTALGDEEQRDFLGLGMADALITRLSLVRSLTVRPTSAVQRHLGVVPDPVAVGRELGVDGVLEGTVQRADQRVRTTVRLLAVSDGATLWAEKFDAVAQDLFTLQDLLSERVAEALQLELSAPERQRMNQRTTRSAAAWEAYVRGRYFWQRRNEESLRRAMDCFRQALELDPGFAEAHAGLADCFVLLPLYAGEAPRAAFPLARESAERALRLDQRCAEAWTSLAYTQFFFDWSFEAAEESFRTALANNPSYATAHHWYAFFLAARGRFPEAIARARTARQCDPLSLVINTDLAFVAYFARRFDEAAAQLRRTLELDAGFAYAHAGRALALVERGELRSATNAGRRAVSLAPTSPFMLATLGYVLARAGDTVGAEEVLAELAERGTRQHVQATYQAIVLAGLDRRAAALDALERALAERSNLLAFLVVWPVFDRLREEPRFAALVAALEGDADAGGAGT